MRFFLSIFALVASCLGPVIFGRESLPNAPQFHLIISDRQDLKRFIITLESSDSRTLCLDRDKWPNFLGHLHFGSTWVRLTSNKAVYPARDDNFGRCLGADCVIRIKPKSRLKGFIGYQEFGDPEKIARLRNRHLYMTLSPWVCRVGP